MVNASLKTNDAEETEITFLNRTYCKRAKTEDVNGLILIFCYKKQAIAVHYYCGANARSIKTAPQKASHHTTTTTTLILIEYIFYLKD